MDHNKLLFRGYVTSLIVKYQHEERNTIKNIKKILYVCTKKCMF